MMVQTLLLSPLLFRPERAAGRGDGRRRAAAFWWISNEKQVESAIQTLSQVSGGCRRRSALHGGAEEDQNGLKLQGSVFN